MRTIRRLYIREFFKMLGILALGLSLIFSLLDLVDKIDDFMPGGPSVGKFALYVLLNMPKYLYYLLPTASLISCLFIFSQASRNMELVTIKASGGRLKNLFYPFVVLGLLLSALGFVIGEVIVPDFSEKADELKGSPAKNEEKLSFREGTLWLRGKDGAFIKIDLYVPGKKMARGVSVFIIGDNRLKKRIEAGEAFWDGARGSGGLWKFNNVVIYDFENGAVVHDSEMDYKYLDSPDLFGKRLKRVEEMDIKELYRYTKRLEAAGFSDTKLLVDLNSKVSYPLSNLFMVILGISLSVLSRIGGGLFAAGFGILISFIYWLLYTLMLSMGYTRLIPPTISTWVAPMIFGIVAIFLFRKIPE
jgi:lipopolysaccharide export system permease protein